MKNLARVTSGSSSGSARSKNQNQELIEILWNMNYLIPHLIQHNEHILENILQVDDHF
jgi:hypothetical protein